MRIVIAFLLLLPVCFAQAPIEEKPILDLAAARLKVETLPVTGDKSEAFAAVAAVHLAAAAVQTEKSVIALDDLEYQGSFQTPTKAVGQSTGYSAGLLAFRRVGTSKRLFSDTHVSSKGLLYEMEVPELTKAAPFKTAAIIKEWGDIYGGKRLDQSGKSVTRPVCGLRWSESTKTLIWVYCKSYNTEDRLAPTIGMTTLNDDILTASGAWRVDGEQLWNRSGTVCIPRWWSDKYAPGRTLGVGFGGAYSIFAGGSYGPTLAAVKTPDASNTFPSKLKPLQLLAYPAAHKAIRTPDYSIRAGVSYLGDDPLEKHGFWTAADDLQNENYGAGAVWLDLPTKHGLLYLPSLATGEVYYGEGPNGKGVNVGGRKNMAYIYDPDELGRVAKGELKPWEPVPKYHEMPHPATGLVGRFAGVAFDEVDSVLYVIAVRAVKGTFESYPAVHAYKVK
jgi:hypothetical protein